MVVLPKARERMMEELHETHPGICRMKSLARSHVWWPNLAPSALISWPGRGTLGNPFPSLTKSISVGSLTSRQILCSMQQPIIVEDTVSSDSSSLFSRHLHLPFNSPNACSTTTIIIIIIIIIITLIVTSS